MGRSVGDRFRWCQTAPVKYRMGWSHRPWLGPGSFGEGPVCPSREPYEPQPLTSPAISLSVSLSASPVLPGTLLPPPIRGSCRLSLRFSSFCLLPLPLFPSDRSLAWPTKDRRGPKGLETVEGPASCTLVSGPRVRPLPPPRPGRLNALRVPSARVARPGRSDEGPEARWVGGRGARTGE